MLPTGIAVCSGSSGESEKCAINIGETVLFK